MQNHSSMTWGLSTPRGYLGWCPNPRGESLTADLLLRGGLTQLVLWWDTIYTWVKSDMWSALIGWGPRLPVTVYLAIVTIKSPKSKGSEQKIRTWKNQISLVGKPQPLSGQVHLTAWEHSSSAQQAGSHSFLWLWALSGVFSYGGSNFVEYQKIMI